MPVLALLFAREFRAEKRPEIAASGNGREIVDLRNQSSAGQPGRYPERVGRRPDPAARKREADAGFVRRPRKLLRLRLRPEALAAILNRLPLRRFDLAPFRFLRFDSREDPHRKIVPQIDLPRRIGSRPVVVRRAGLAHAGHPRKNPGAFSKLQAQLIQLSPEFPAHDLVAKPGRVVAQFLVLGHPAMPARRVRADFLVQHRNRLPGELFGARMLFHQLPGRLENRPDALRRRFLVA